MIDNIKITIQNFRGNFDCCKKVGFLYGKSVYRLYNHEKGKEIFLLLEYNGGKKELIINNSIRKWYLGGFSLSDLTQETAYKAFKKISQLLGIDLDDFRKATFTQCEIGLNLRMSIPAYEIIPLVVKYSTFKRYIYENETVGFIGTDRTLKMYNKCEELLDHNKKYDKKTKEHTFKVLTDKNYNFLRIELNMLDKQSFINKKLYKLQTIGDILDNYLSLYEFWIKEMSAVILLNELIMEEEMTSNQYMIAKILQLDGYNKFKNNCLNRSQGNTRSKLNKDALAVIDRYSNPKKYNTTKFKDDIIKNLERIKSKEKKLNIGQMTANLYT